MRTIYLIPSTFFFFSVSFAFAQISDGDGIVKPYREATLSLSVLGLVDELPVCEGDFVEMDQVLLRFNVREEDLEIENQKLIMEDNEVRVETAREIAEVFSETAASTRELYEESQSVSREKMNEKKLAARQASTDLNILEVESKREALALEIAKEKRSQKILRAPFPGIVTDVFPELGEVREQGQPLIRLVDRTRCYFESYVEPGRASQLSEGQVMELEIFEGDTVTRFPAEIDHISPVVDVASGLRKVKLLFDNTELGVTPGLSGRIVEF